MLYILYNQISCVYKSTRKYMYTNILISFIEICVHTLLTESIYQYVRSGAAHGNPSVELTGSTPDVSVHVRYVRETH